jgi:hypothetical protein
MTKEFSQEDFRQLSILALLSLVELTEERKNHLSGSCSPCRTFAQIHATGHSRDCSQISSARGSRATQASAPSLRLGALGVNVKPVGDIRLEKDLLLGGRFERNGLGWCNQHRVLSRLLSCWSPSTNGGPSPVSDE